MPRGTLYPKAAPFDWTHFVFEGGIDPVAWHYAELEDAVERAKRGLPPRANEYGRSYFLWGKKELPFHLWPYTFPERIPTRRQILEWEEEKPFAFMGLDKAKPKTFVRDVARIREWLERGLPTYDLFGAVVFFFVERFRQSFGRLPTIAEVKSQLWQLGVDIPMNWARAMSLRPIIPRLPAGPRGPDAHQRAKSRKGIRKPRV